MTLRVELQTLAVRVEILLMSGSGTGVFQSLTMVKARNGHARQDRGEAARVDWQERDKVNSG
jgi:hypothetical protein